MSFLIKREGQKQAEGRLFSLPPAGQRGRRYPASGPPHCLPSPRRGIHPAPSAGRSPGSSRPSSRPAWLRAHIRQSSNTPRHKRLFLFLLRCTRAGCRTGCRAGRAFAFCGRLFLSLLRLPWGRRCSRIASQKAPTPNRASEALNQMVPIFVFSPFFTIMLPEGGGGCFEGFHAFSYVFLTICRFRPFGRLWGCL